MNSTIVSRETVAEHFAVTVGVLRRYEAEGFVQPQREGNVEGYGPAEIRRVWTIVSLQRDLGINLAGVDAVLKLRSHLDEVHRCLRSIAEELRQTLEDELGPDESR